MQTLLTKITVDKPRILNGFISVMLYKIEPINRTQDFKFYRTSCYNFEHE